MLVCYFLDKNLQMYDFFGLYFIFFGLYFIIDLKCDRGSYRIECNETCGHCRDVNQCSNGNGSCLTGCDAGFKGDLCKTGE